MEEPRSDRQQEPGHDDIKAEAADQGDPLSEFVAHAKELFAAGRTRISVFSDETTGKIRRMFLRLVFFIFAVAFSFVLACLGGYYLVSGSVTGVEMLIGSRWEACVIVGISCLACSTALIAFPLWHFRRMRMKKLREKYEHLQAGKS